MRLRPTKFLAFVHRWLGFPLAVLFLAVLVSGQYIAIGNLTSRLYKHGQHYAPVPLEQAGRDLAKLLVRYLWFLVIANGLLIVMVATALLSFLQKTYRPIDMRFLKHLGVRLYQAR